MEFGRGVKKYFNSELKVYSRMKVYEPTVDLLI